MFESIFEPDQIIHGALIKNYSNQTQPKLYSLKIFDIHVKHLFSVVFLFESRTCTIKNMAINYGEKQDKIKPIEA